ncbi:hypothetical protein M8H82_36245, partial [Streptomyces sp. YS415]|nr:hypothetical protein [Streptomyces sp. YS415]
MTAEPLLTALPYHRMARYTGHHRWWRPVLGLLLLLTGLVVAFLVIDAVVHGAGPAAGMRELPDGSVRFGDRVTTAMGLLV